MIENASSAPYVSISASSSHDEYNTILNELNPKSDYLMSFNLKSQAFVPSFKKPQSYQGEPNSNHSQQDDSTGMSRIDLDINQVTL